jgi:hypothetical protein
MDNKKIISYRFELENGTVYSFDIPVFALPTEANDDVERQAKAPWTKLDFHQCEGCTYKKSNYCPVAVRLQEPAKVFSKLLSYEKATITVTTPERTYSKHTDIQDGLASMLGLIMATTECPTTRAFFPAAWFHLPFASFEETLFRITSVWMLKQFFSPAGVKDYEQVIRAIKKQCSDTHDVNIGIFRRLKESGIADKDASFNAVSILNAFASLMPLSLDDKLEEFSQLFQRNLLENSAMR